MSRNKFPVGNSYGGRKVGSKGQINKADAVKLVNLLLDDLTTNYNTLTIWQKIKILSIMKDVLRDSITDISEQVTDNNITIKIVNNDSNYNECA